MELKEILTSRRSIRKFNDKEVSTETIESLLNAALQAPSSRNSRSTHFVVLRNSETITKIASMRDYGSAFIKGAPIFILVAGDSATTDLWEVNCSISATILQLAATDMGLASCWVHINGRPQLKSEPDGATAEEHVRSLVTLPENLSLLCGIAIGYSDFCPAPLPEFDGASRVTILE